MKNISSKDLRGKLKSGWKVDKVDPGKPKKKPKPLIKEQVADAVKESSRETAKAIGEMASAMTACFNEQTKNNSDLCKQLNKISDIKVVVDIPEPKSNNKKKRWKFKVERDGRGFIDNITAEEI